jgi:membrane-bound serine protease (ClpP class)
MRCTVFLFFTLIALCVGFPVRGQADRSTNGGEKLVYVFDISEEIFPPALRKFESAMAEADSLGADVIVMKLDTYGGRVDVADKMRTALLNADALMLAFIQDNAASAGALLSISCDSIYMKEYATIGAAMVVDDTGGAASEKYQSYWRQRMAATAEMQGRDTLIAVGMVDPKGSIPGVKAEGQLISFRASQALRHDFCDAIVEDVEEALAHAGITDYRIVEYTPSVTDQIVAFLTQPIVSSILLMLIFFGLFFELQSPGIGFPLVAAITAAVLYFVPLYIDGLAQNWEILVFVIGVVLIGLELFVIPGFGIAGVSGIALVFLGLVLSLIKNVRFDFSGVDPGAAATSVMVVLSAMLGTAAILIVFAKRLNTARIFRPLILDTSEKAEAGYDVDSFRGHDIVGKEGIAVTVLRPSGKIEIDGERYDAFTEGEFAERGDPVRVIRAKGTALVVERISG